MAPIGVQLVAVLVEHRAEPGDVVALRFDHVRVDEPEPDLAQRLEVRRVHVGVGARLHRHERLDAPPHLPLVDQRAVAARRAAGCRCRARAACARGRRAPSGMSASRSRIVSLARTLYATAVIEPGLQPAVDEQPEPFGEHARLARARGRDDARRARCRARPPRAGRPRARRVRRDRAVGGEHALLEVVAVDEHVTVGDRRGARARAAVAPRGRAVGEHARRRRRTRPRRAAAPRRSGPTPCGRPGRRSCWRGRGSRGARARTRSGARARTAAAAGSISGARSSSAAHCSSTTTGMRCDQCRCSTSSASVGSRSTASSTTTRSASGPRLGRGRAGADDDTPPEAGDDVGVGQIDHGSHHARAVRRPGPGPSRRQISRARCRRSRRTTPSRPGSRRGCG